MAYDVPEIQDPHEYKKLTFLTIIILGLCGGVYYILRCFAKPPPETLSPAWKEAVKKRLIAEGANPIWGITAKARAKENVEALE